MVSLAFRICCSERISILLLHSHTLLGARFKLHSVIGHTNTLNDRCGWTCNQLTWRRNWKSAQVVNSHLVCDPTIRQPGFDLLRQQWSLLNRFRTEQGHCGACGRKWRLTDTDLCPCYETQTMSHIVESCPLTKLNGGLSRLHSADEDAVSWLTSYGKWHAYEKKSWFSAPWGYNGYAHGLELISIFKNWSTRCFWNFITNRRLEWWTFQA